MKNSISFGAKFIQNSTIQKYNPTTKKYMPEDVSFIEIIPKDNNDKRVLKQLNKQWQGPNYTGSILDDMLECSSDYSSINSRFFAITTQKKNLKHLDHKLILGLAEMELSDPKTPFLEYLQVHPNFIGQLFESKCKHIGTAILDSLKNMYSSITLHSTDSALDFYKKNGFKLIDHSSFFSCHWIKK